MGILATAAVASPAQQQTASGQGDATSLAQHVEITGSRLKQIDAEGVSPLQVLHREDIARTGATTLRELLDTLSSSSTTGTLSDLTGSSSFASGASGVSLRNLGKQSTLVLLNGRRLPAYPLADYAEVFTNVDILPLGVVDRIEILKNGGSALYGSEAVAGVINVITRPQFNGLQIDLTSQKSLRNGMFRERSGGLTGGAGDYAAKGWDLLGNVELYHRDELMWNRVLKDVNPAYVPHSAGLGTASTYSYPGNLIGVGPIAGCATVVDGLCTYDRYSRFEAVPATRRANFFLSGRRRLDDETQFFAELLFSDIHASYVGIYPTYGGEENASSWGDPTTGVAKTFYDRDLPATNPLNPTGAPVELRYRFVDAPSYRETSTTQYRVLTGLKGTTRAIDWETAVGVMGGTTRDINREGTSDSGFKKEIGDYGQPDPITGELTPVPADFFNIPGGYRIGQPNSAAVIDTLFPEYGFAATDRQFFWDGSMRTDIGALPAGPVQLAAGYELRHEEMIISPTSNLADGDIVGYGTSASDASRAYGAVFAEASLPLTRMLEGQVAARLDKFPRFGAHVSPKLGLKFKPVDQALLRATYETGFRAPNLVESAPSTKFSFSSGFEDPKRCDQAYAYATDLSNEADGLPAGDPKQASLYARAQEIYGNECAAGVSERTANNPGLKPETSKSFTFGTVLQPLPRWSASIDYWNVRRRNEIDKKDIQDLLATEGSQPPGVINRQTSFANDRSFSNDPNGLSDAAVRAKYGVVDGDYALTSINNTFVNIAQTRTDGVDLGVKGAVSSALGDIGLDIDASYTHSYRVFSALLNAFGDNLAGRYDFPKFVVNTTVSLNTGVVDQSLRFVYRSPTALQDDFDDKQWNQAGCANAGLSPSECRIKSYRRVDYAVSYTGLRHLTLGLFIGNLLQRRPPVDYRAFGAPAGVIPISTEDAAGRTCKLSLSYNWQ